MGVVQALHFMNEIRYRSYGVRSHERGGHSTGPFLEIRRSPNLPFNKSIVKNRTSDCPDIFTRYTEAG